MFIKYIGVEKPNIDHVHIVFKMKSAGENVRILNGLKTGYSRIA